MTEKLKRSDPDFYRKLAKLSQESWEKNGRKPRGFAANPELARRANLKAMESIRKKKK